MELWPRDIGDLEKDHLLLPAVLRTITALELTEKDQGAVKLAEKYAAVIDENPNPSWAMRWIGPLLLDALESLGATPAARDKIKNGAPANAGSNRLHALRSARKP